MHFEFNTEGVLYFFQSLDGNLWRCKKCGHATYDINDNEQDKIMKYYIGNFKEYEKK